MNKAIELISSLRKAVGAAYTGSAEHGAFLRGTRTEYVPSPFMVLNQLSDAIKEEKTSMKAELEKLPRFDSDPSWGCDVDVDGRFVKLADVLAVIND